MTTIPTTDAKALKSALKAVSPAIQSRSSIKALESVLIGNGRIVATDMTCQIDAPCAAATFEPMLVPVEHLKKILGALKPADHVALSPTDDGLQVTSTHGDSTIPTIDVDDFPAPMGVGMDRSILHASDAADLLARILRVSSIASGDDSRPVLQATLLATANDSLEIVSTDSYRLAADSVAFTGDNLRMLIPTAAKYLKHASGIDRVEASAANGPKCDDGALFARLTDADSDVTYTFRCTDGKFPDHRQLIPTIWEQVVDLPAGIDATLAYMAKAIIKRNEPVRLAFDECNGLELSARVQDGPQHAKAFDLTSAWEGEGFTIGANADYLRDGLQLLGDNPRMSMISPLRPMLLESDSSLRYLLMPVRLT